MTWKITETSDENVVNVEFSFTVSNRQLVSGSGYTPDVSLMFLTGTIRGTRLTLTTGGGQFSESRTVGEFSFTTDIITGTWSDHWSMCTSKKSTPPQTASYCPNNNILFFLKHGHNT